MSNQMAFGMVDLLQSICRTRSGQGAGRSKRLHDVYITGLEKLVRNWLYKSVYS
jgi:hypothetical protein